MQIARSAGLEPADYKRVACLPRGHLGGAEGAKVMAVAAEDGPGGDDWLRDSHLPAGFGPGEHELREWRGAGFEGSGATALRFH